MYFAIINEKNEYLKVEFVDNIFCLNNKGVVFTSSSLEVIKKVLDGGEGTLEIPSNSFKNLKAVQLAINITAEY